MKVYVLDANALYRFLTNGPGAETVDKLFKQALRRRQTLLISVINWGEVHYSFARSLGYKEAERIMLQAESLPLSVIDTDKVQAESAARVKAGYGLHYADCFAAVLTGKTGVLVTTDMKDFTRVPWIATIALPPHAG